MPALTGLHRRPRRRESNSTSERSPALLADHVLDRAGPVGEHALRRRGVAEDAVALEDVRERVAPRVHRERLAPCPAAPRRRGSSAPRRRRRPDRSLPQKLAADHAHARAVVVDHLGDRARRHVLVARRRQLERRGRFAQSWNPCMRPSASPCGISWCRMPRPPSSTGCRRRRACRRCPRLSPCVTVPAST